MSTAWIIKVSAACLIFDGIDYPYWKTMMCKHMKETNYDLRTVTDHGLTDLCKKACIEDISIFTQLDALACPKINSLMYVICT